MSESFMKASRRKQEIESKIDELDRSKAYMISYTQLDFLEMFETLKQRLEVQTSQISTEIEQLSTAIDGLILSIQNDYSISNESKSIQKKKASNMIAQVNELTSFLRRATNKKLDELRQEKDKFNLYGTSRPSFDNSMSVSERQRQNIQAISANSQLTHEMIGSGRDILHSFKQQGSTLRNVQKKVVNIVSELGLTNQLLRVIGSRSRSDNIIICVLFLVLMAFMALCYFVIRPFVRG